jgi:signal transduction histidine kinase
MPEVARERQRGRLLLELARRVTGTLDVPGVVSTALDGLREIVPFERGGIRLDAQPGAGSEPVYVTADDGTARSYFAVPLLAGGETIGVLELEGSSSSFSDEDRDTVLALAPSIAAAVQNARLFEREQHAVAELREAQRMQRDFLAVVSHELRTPLTAIAGFAETLRSDAASLSADDVAAVGDRIGRAGRRLERLIVDLLDISQLERAQLAVNLVQVPPNTLAAVVLDAIDSMGVSGHTVRLDVADGLPPVLADERRVRQVVEHLLDNARKFSPAASEIVVSLAPEEDGAHVAVSVTDQGPGIPAEMQPRVFERFFQVESPSTRSAGGLGVGLYLVRRLCDLMNASVDIDSAAGEGTRFTVRIPVARPGRS